MLRIEDFATFFKEVHGVDPFPWQQRLLEHLVEHGSWPGTLDLPTGSGKTAAIDIAVFHLALEASRGSRRKAPLRIAFVVDRRLVVDDAHARAVRIEQALSSAVAADTASGVLPKVAEALQALALGEPPLIARRLRGGIPREDDWARTPSQPTVLCSTVDQIGSRLLFRGYGISDSMKPVHAGLIGADCLILLDEAHLAEPFRQTLGWVQCYRGETWRTSPYAAPWGVALLTATPGETSSAAFHLSERDRAHPVLQRRLAAHKRARLRMEANEVARQQAFADEVRQALDAGAQAIGVVLNRVTRARDLHSLLKHTMAPERADLLLLIGPARPVQRDALAERLQPIRTGARAALARPLVIVATQCIEAGVDIDLDALFTEAAPLDALRQRFGRLNRDGRSIDARAAIIAIKEEVGSRANDPVYQGAIREAWLQLNAAADGAPPASGKRKPESGALVDFGIEHFRVAMPREALTLKPNAPVLMPSHVDLLSHTAPVPAADPEVALFLHGPQRQPDAVTVIWRADLHADARHSGDIPLLLTLMPPRAEEAIELPVWAVRRWLSHLGQSIEAFADIPTAVDGDEERAFVSQHARQVFRWRGPGEDSTWIRGDQVRAGDTIVVPAELGGVDEFGWNPAAKDAAVDLADAAARSRRGRYFAVRVATGLLGASMAPERLSALLSQLRADDGLAVAQSLLSHLPPAENPCSPVALLRLLKGARARRGRSRIEAYFDVYEPNGRDEPQGVVLVAPHGLKKEPIEATRDSSSPATEDDLIGSAAGFALSLEVHSTQVEAKAEQFAQAAGLPPERVADLALAGWLHDQGKADRRFQRWMHHGDPLGADPDDPASVLAKSGRALPPSSREKAGLPAHWRHEACSVRLARRHERLQRANDADLVLWLVGTHHGHGRPLFPHQDPDEPASDPGPQALAFDWKSQDWPTLFNTLKARYGVWELARMEAILRLADHRASAEAALQAEQGDAA